MLTEMDRELLDVAGTFTSYHEVHTGPVMFARFGNVTRAWQQLNALIDHPDAMQYAPATVHRLRRIRDERKRGRRARTTG